MEELKAVPDELGVSAHIEVGAMPLLVPYNVLQPSDEHATYISCAKLNFR